MVTLILSAHLYDNLNELLIKTNNFTLQASSISNCIAKGAKNILVFTPALLATLIPLHKLLHIQPRNAMDLLNNLNM